MELPHFNRWGHPKGLGGRLRSEFSKESTEGNRRTHRERKAVQVNTPCQTAQRASSEPPKAVKIIPF